MDDGTEVKIVLKRLNKGEEVFRLPKYLEVPLKKVNMSTNIRVSWTKTLEPQRKTMVIVKKEKLGVNSLKTHKDIYQKNEAI